MQTRIGLLALGTFTIGTDVFVIAGVIPSVANDLRVSSAAAGWLLTAFAVAYAFGSPILATAFARVPRKLLLTASLAAFSVANGIAVFASGYDLLLGARVMAALAAAMYTPTAAAVAAAAVPSAERGRALATVMGGMTIAILFGVPLGAWIGETLTWRYTFAFIAGIGTLATIGIAILIPAVPPTAIVSLRERLRPLRKRSVLAALGVTVLATAGGFTLYTYLAPYLIEFDHAGPTGVSAALFLFGAFSVMGNVLGGKAADRFGPHRVIRFGLFTVAFALLAVRLASSSAIAVSLAIALWGVAGWLYQAPLQHRLIGIADSAQAVALALNGSAIYAGIAIGSGLGGLLLRGGLLAFLGIVGSALAWSALALDYAAFGLGRSRACAVECR
ncbi:MAG: MFS transporter [Bacilli bacterium]